MRRRPWKQVQAIGAGPVFANFEYYSLENVKIGIWSVYFVVFDRYRSTDTDADTDLSADIGTDISVSKM